MCGICGKISRESVRPSELSRMMDRLAHRGPDDEGSWIEGTVGLGHRRLSIIDLTGGRQPISNEDESIWIVCNGEIYNYRELKKELVQQGHRFRTESDTEVIVHLYEETGIRCVERLRGMFSFAIWDTRSRTLVAARDRLGQKPFFYHERAGEFLFASEIKAILASDTVKPELCPEALDQYLALRLIAPPLTMFRGIQKLPPAHWLTYSVADGVRIERYWHLSYEPKRAESEDDLVDELEARLISCLKAHLVSDVPVGAFLSGGIDSTLLVAILMKQKLCDPIQTFTMGLRHEAFDEAPAARLVAEQYQTCHREQSILPSMTAALPKLIWHLDEPSDPLALCSYLIAEMASQHVKVVIGGDGGDELFGGYDRYYGNRYADRYARVPLFLRRGVMTPLLRRMPEGSWYKSRGHQLKWLHQLSFLDGGARYARSLNYFYFDASQRDLLYAPEMRAGLGSSDPEAVIRQAYDGSDARAPLDRMLGADSMIRLPDHPVMILDRMTMAHGLEARSPLMDHELAEFAARLPVNLKVRGRTLRAIQMKLAERYLPAEILSRPKQGFSSALPYMLREEYKTLFDLFLTDSHLVRDSFLAQTPITRLLRAHLAGRADHGNRLWLILNSELWYRMLVKGIESGDILDRISSCAAEPRS